MPLTVCGENIYVLFWGFGQRLFVIGTLNFFWVLPKVSNSGRTYSLYSYSYSYIFSIDMRS